MLDRVVYWLFRLAILLTRPLPLRLGYWFGERVALICYWVIFPRHRKALNANLAHVLQSDDPRFVDAVARRTFRNFGKYVIDFIHFPVITPEEVRQRLRFDQWDELNAATASGRGLIITTLHFGNWDLGAAALAAYGYPINAIAETFRYGPMNQLVQGSRSKLGMKVIGHDRLGPALFRALRRGEMLAMLVDVASRDVATRVDFFGAPALVSSAAARIALRTGAWVLPAVVVRGPEDDLEIRPIIDFSLRDFTATGEESKDVAELTRLIMQSMEPIIRNYPDQWFIFRRMWDQPAPQRASAPQLAEEL
ncbi:MAG: lysophospholipid acyltransferase family protein [Chloroflexota bacterium]|nr:lysophospholipid acyltransferase family protein [Chloroflexota bacterium]